MLLLQRHGERKDGRERVKDTLHYYMKHSGEFLCPTESKPHACVIPFRRKPRHEVHMFCMLKMSW